MKKIKLTQNKFALIDDEDYDYLSQFTWGLTGKKNHVVRKIWNGRDKTPIMDTIHLSRELLSCPSGKVVDHIDRNPLNNQKSNLRICTLAENNRNRVKSHKKCSSKFKGVHFFKRTGSWQTYITFEGIRQSLGYFKDEKAAALAYNKKAQELFGEFALLNQV